MDTARGVTGPLEDYRLRDMLEGVAHIPHGRGAHIFTAAALLADRTGDNVRLSGYQAYVASNWAQLGIQQIALPTGPNGLNPDVDAKFRFERDPAILSHARNIGYRNL